MLRLPSLTRLDYIILGIVACVTVIELVFWFIIYYMVKLFVTKTWRAW